MQLKKYSQVFANSRKKNFIYRKVEIAIRSSLTVDDCIVIERQAKNLTQELVAYVVPSGLFAPEKLLSDLQTILPSEFIPSAFIPVSTIPLTDTGKIDEVALANLEIIDFDLVHCLEEQLQSVAEIEQVAVVIEPLIKSIPPVHLEDLLGVEDSLQTVQVTTPQEKLVSKNLSSSNKLAISHGETLQHSADAPQTLPTLLQCAAQNSIQSIIYIQADGSEKIQSYRELWQDAQRILAGLRKLGLKPQDKVIFQLEDNQDFLCGFWACVLGGFVPVPISVASTYELANSIASKLQNTWQMLSKPLVLTNAALAPKIDELSTILHLENFQLAIIDHLRQCEPDVNLYPSQPEDLAILFLTSGSTGVPKCVMLNHHNLLSMTTGLIVMGDFSSQESILNWMPLDHVGALVSLSITAVNLGCQQIHIPTSLIVQHPLKWLDLIHNYQATISWAPNFAFALICERASDINHQHWDLSSMRFIINAGEPIVTKIARNFLQMLRRYGLPTNAIHPAFGMSETSSGITYSDSFALESSSDDALFVELGLPIAGASLRIVDENEQIVTENTIGRLQVQGASVTSGYYQNPQATQAAFTVDGWFNTGDLGFLNQGRLTITGRIKDVIIINGLNYYCHEIESAVEEVKGVEVSYTAACAVRQAESNTDKLAIFFHTSITDDSSLVNLLQEIRNSVVTKVGINPDYLIPVDQEMIPKTAIGKIQRSQLSQRYKTGEFQSIIKRIDILLGNANTIPDWFYRQIWQPKSPIIYNFALNISNYTLVFLDNFGLGAYLCKLLADKKLPYITVSPGEYFCKINQSHYTITPNKPKEYQRLIQSLAADNIIIEQILHLWTYDQYIGEIKSLENLEQAQKQGIYSLLFLTQALAKINGDDNYIQLLFISSYIQAIYANDPIAYEKSTLLGLLKTIPQELPWLNCRHIDLPFAEVETNAAYILQELEVHTKEREVAYRSGQRFVPRLEKIDFIHEPQSSVSFKQKGTYLITGGLGGIGIEIARYLLKNYQARLLLVGKTPLIDKSKKNAYQELKQLGGEVVYEAVDICDEKQLQIIVKKAQSRWKKNLDGIIYLAGSFHEKIVLEETQENLAAILRPKLLGTWVLHQLLKDNQDSIFINFSSAHGFFGSTAVGAYAAANSFLNCFSHYQNNHSGLTSYCLSWSMWDDIGMSQGYEMQNLIRAKGFYVMSSSQAISSMLVSLKYQQTNIFIGLDGSNQNIQRWQSQAFNLQKLTAYFTSSKESIRLPDFQVQDRFGTTCIYDVVQLPQMPCLENGEIDRASLIKGSNTQHKERIAPRNEIERKIAQCWQQVMRLSHLSVHDNFFELGGNSLLAGQVIARLREDFSLELSLERLFKAPTIASLSQTIEAIQGLTQDKIAAIEVLTEEYEEVKI